MRARNFRHLHADWSTSCWGDPEITDLQVELLQNTIRESGALDDLELIIEQNLAVALAAVVDAPLGRAAKRQLTGLAETVTRRTS